MIDLDTRNIRLGARATNKQDAIRQCAALLVDGGYIQRGYAESMLAREAVANTFLGHGIAIPHGMLADRELIVKTGVAVLQLPDGVVWNPGEIAYLLIGIAARSDEHVDVLANLTRLLDDEATIQRLSGTREPRDVVQALTNDTAAAPAVAPLDIGTGIDVTIRGAAGLHARPATAFVAVARRFAAEIRVRHGAVVANGKSLVSLLTLGAGRGASLRLMAQGADADAALRALAAAIEAGLGDDESHAATPAAERERGSSQRAFASRPIAGIAAAPGLAIGPLWQLRRDSIVVATRAADPAAEELRLRQAIAAARAHLHDLRADVSARAGAGSAAIFDAHESFLDDPEMQEAAHARIAQGYSAGWSWRDTYEVQATAIERQGDALLALRAADLRDVGQRVLRLLGETAAQEPSIPDHPVILIAEDLTPSDTARLDPRIVLGLCTASGGPTSHTAIIARSLDIAAVVGAGDGVLKQPDGRLCILDGDGGNLYVDPSDDDLEAARRAQTDLQQVREDEKLACYLPAITTDGHRIEVVANIASAKEAEQAVAAGGEGVGLLRTEFLFLERDTAPSEDEQCAAYTAMARALGGLPLILRTLDIGGDKEAPYLDLPKEENPFLGLRGIRLCLARPELFRTQLRAVFRAARTGPIKLMFPMIATLEDLRAARAIYEDVRRELGAPALEIGIMIEVPSAVVMADELAREVDFFSVGTNDLTQYTLAMDRGHPVLARQADGLHPAVLRMIDKTVRAATAAGKWVGVCGGIAGEPRGAIILVGLGVAELSVSIPSISAIKARIRQLSRGAAEDLARRALACSSAAEVRELPLP